MKKMKNQGGFTLIELVVVFVILGILAATAIPRFTTVTNQSRTAVADGITGAIQSAAVIQYAANSGAASTSEDILEQVACDTDEVVTVTIGGGTQTLACTGNFPADGTLTSIGPCNTADLAESVTVNVGGQNGNVRNIPAGLCSG